MQQLRNLKDLTGFALEARDGEIGKVKEIYFDDQDWFIRYFVVRTGGWLRGREVLVTPWVILSIDEGGRRLVVDLSREQVEKSPPVSTERPVSRHYEAEYHRYYGLEPYWTMGPLGAPPAPRPVALPSAPPRAPEHPHLRSSDEVLGYRIATHDGEFGRVEDFIVDDSDWSIAYVLVDTHRWLAGKRVLVAPTWIQSVDWSGRCITVDLDRDAIEGAPAYDASRLITRDYEADLFAHFGKSLYGLRREEQRGATHA